MSRKLVAQEVFFSGLFLIAHVGLYPVTFWLDIEQRVLVFQAHWRKLFLVGMVPVVIAAPITVEIEIGDVVATRCVAQCLVKNGGKTLSDLGLVCDFLCGGWLGLDCTESSNPDKKSFRTHE